MAGLLWGRPYIPQPRPATPQFCPIGVLMHPQCAPRGHDLDGLVLIVHGDIPPAAGLSSSSALVVASALAFLWALDITLAPTDLAQLCIACERLIGTAGGGMDQSASILAKPGQALYIEFEPVLLATPVPLPEVSLRVMKGLPHTRTVAPLQPKTLESNARTLSRTLSSSSPTPSWPRRRPRPPTNTSICVSWKGVSPSLC